jgi:hypothetical protein
MNRWEGMPLELQLLDRVAADLIGKGYDFNSPRFKYQMHAVIIRYFLGDEWFARHCKLDAVDNFLKPKFEGDNPDWDYSFNVLMLAEMLFNLQGVPGFQDCIIKLQGRQIEAAFAELEVGAVIAKAGLGFRYVDPNSQRGRTYDLDIATPHGPACGEIKCKSLATAPTPEKVADAIKKARKQLPGDAAGIVFIKLPPEWVEVQWVGPLTPAVIKIPSEINVAASQALSETKRVKRIVFYVVNKVPYLSVGLSVTTLSSERSNPRNGESSPWNDEMFRPDSRAKWLSVIEMHERWALLRAKGAH